MAPKDLGCLRSSSTEKACSSCSFRESFPARVIDAFPTQPPTVPESPPASSRLGQGVLRTRTCPKQPQCPVPQVFQERPQVFPSFLERSRASPSVPTIPSSGPWTLAFHWRQGLVRPCPTGPGRPKPKPSLPSSHSLSLFFALSHSLSLTYLGT